MKFKRIIVAFLMMSVICLGGLSIDAFAHSSEPVIEEIVTEESAANIEPVASIEQVIDTNLKRQEVETEELGTEEFETEEIVTQELGTEEVEPTALTPEGNMSLVDDIDSKASEDKQFITVVTKNGNYFYIILDRAKDGDNTVHFLNQIDESDLLSLMDDDEAAKYETSASLNESVPIATESVAIEPQMGNTPDTGKKSTTKVTIIIISIFIVLLGGGFIAYKKLKAYKKSVNEKPDTDDDYEEQEDEFDYDDETFDNDDLDDESKDNDRIDNDDETEDNEIDKDTIDDNEIMTLRKKY